MYLVYIDEEDNYCKEFLKVFENIDAAIDFAVDIAYEKVEHKFTKEYLRELLVRRIIDNPDNEYGWDIPYNNLAWIAIAKVEKGD